MTVVLALAGLPLRAAAAAIGTEAVILGAGDPNAIKDSYIVVLGEGSVSADWLAAKHHTRVEYTYRHALRGFAGTMSERAARRLAAEPGVAYVQQDRVISLAATQSPVPSWGLDRVDQRDLPLNNSYSYPNTGSSVTAYIIDTGIRISHTAFGNRALWGTNTIDAINGDCNGHGTHVAGTVGGTSHGVAKGVRLRAVKVLNCFGTSTSSAVAAGVDWVTGNHLAGAPAVATMSLGAQGSDTAIENAVRNSIADGVVYVIASGNSNASACGFTPARVAEAITVNASTNTDARASFSNFGPCTDVFAPGENIVSAGIASDTAAATLSGTSMATPHVAGAVALILEANPSLTPAQAASTLLTNATSSKVTNAGSGSPNLLLFVPSSGSGGPVVAHPGNRTTRAGLATSLQMSASGGTPPHAWSATGLPTGMSIGSTTGLISGTPSSAAENTVVVTATDSAGRTGSTSFSWTVTPNLDNTWACTVPDGYTWDLVHLTSSACGPGTANYFRLRWPVDYLMACTAPPGLVWDQVVNSHNMCSPNNYQWIFRLRVPVNNLTACTVPSGFTWDQVINSHNVCSPNNYARVYRLRVPGDNFIACSVPDGYTYDRVINSYNLCVPSNYGAAYNIRIPVTGLWACHVPPAWTYDSVTNSYNTCSPNNYASFYRLTR